MSHIVSITTEVRDPGAVRAACRRLGLTAPVHGTHKLFTNQATGFAVHLPDWSYPVVCNTRTGAVHYDNYGGTWGDQAQLDRFLQAYAVEKATLEARRQGYSVAESRRADGSIRLQLTGGPA